MKHFVCEYFCLHTSILDLAHLFHILIFSQSNTIQCLDHHVKPSFQESQEVASLFCIAQAVRAYYCCKKHAAVSALSTPAAAFGKRSACAAPKDNKSLSSNEEPLTQFSNHNNLLYAKKDPPPASLKRPALDSNKIAVITPSKSTKNTKVFVKDLCNLACNNDLRLNNLKNYC